MSLWHERAGVATSESQTSSARLYPEVDVLQSEKDGELKKKRKVLEQAAEEDFGNTEWAQWRSWLWNTIEYPWTSKLAQFLALFSLSMVLISTVTFIISTAEVIFVNAQTLSRNFECSGTPRG